MRERRTCPGEEWEQMPTVELDKILQAELEKEYPSQEVVLSILRELEQREKGYPVEKNAETSAIFYELSKHETTSKQSKRRRSWVAGIVALAAVACIVVMAIPRTVGAESIIDVLVRWTSSIFEFVNPDVSESLPQMDGEFSTDNPGLQQLYDKVTELGVTEPVVPTWLPEGFVLTELKELPVPDGKKVYGKFEYGSRFVAVTYWISTDITTKVEKEPTAVEVIEVGEVKHFIVDNDNNLSVTWMLEGTSCLLNANIANEDLHAIIKSIYRSELS